MDCSLSSSPKQLLRLGINLILAEPWQGETNLGCIATHRPGEFQDTKTGSLGHESQVLKLRRELTIGTRGHITHSKAFPKREGRNDQVADTNSLFHMNFAARPHSSCIFTIRVQCLVKHELMLTLESLILTWVNIISDSAFQSGT